MNLPFKNHYFLLKNNIPKKMTLPFKIHHGLRFFIEIFYWDILSSDNKSDTTNVLPPT